MAEFDVVDLAPKTEYRTKSGRVLTEEDIEALAAEAEKGYDVSHLHAHRKTWVVGFFVRVEVEARGASDAIHVANAAANWPGDWQPPMPPIEHTGDLMGKEVSATVVRSIALMAYVKEPDTHTRHRTIHAGEWGD